jgi:signal peptidase I
LGRYHLCTFVRAICGFVSEGALVSDYTAILAGAVVVAGGVALADALVLKRRRPVGADGQPAEPSWIVSQARSLWPVLLAVLVFRSFLFEPFRIPSESMLPGLVDGDFILVNKFSYGLRMPLLNSMLVPTGDPKRGDVIVFRSPSDPDTNLIKRLIGLPGDHVVVKNNRLFVNGALMPLTPDGLYAGGFGFTGSPLAKEKFDDAEHILLLASGRYAKDFDGVVPAGHYFFMGDNRNDSEDSRFPDVGFVPRENLIGHAIRIWMNWQLPGWPKLGRVGMRIQ